MLLAVGVCMLWLCVCGVSPRTQGTAWPRGCSCSSSLFIPIWQHYISMCLHTLVLNHWWGVWSRYRNVDGSTSSDRRWAARCLSNSSRLYFPCGTSTPHLWRQLNPRWSFVLQLIGHFCGISSVNCGESYQAIWAPKMHCRWSSALWTSYHTVGQLTMQHIAKQS